MKSDRRGIDWDLVRARLDASEAALEAALTVSPERLEAVYRERAAALAARGAKGAAAARRVLVFDVGTEQYGLAFGDVTGVLPFDACTPVPGGPAELLGVMNIGGAIRSILDLARLLGLPDAAGSGGYVLLVRWKNRATAVRVDGVQGVRSIDPNDAAVVEAAAPGTRFLSGVTRDGVRLLETQSLLAHPLLGGEE